MEQRPHPTLLRTAELAFVNNRAGGLGIGRNSLPKLVERYDLVSKITQLRDRL